MTSINTSTSNVNMNTLLNSIDLGPAANSIQFQFAKLQLLLAQINKNQAMDYMDSITAEQDRAKKCAQAIENAAALKDSGMVWNDSFYGDAEHLLEYENLQEKYRELYAKHITSNPDADFDTQMKKVESEFWAHGRGRGIEDDELLRYAWSHTYPDHPSFTPDPSFLSPPLHTSSGTEPMPQETYEKLTAVLEFCRDNGIDIPGKLDGGAWDKLVTAMKSRQEQIGTDTQQKMVFLQDFMGQYNSYLSGANSAIQQANQILQSIARGQ